MSETCNPMTASERLLAVLSGRKPDRTPVSLHEIDGFGALYSPDHPSYAGIRKLVRERSDNMVMCAPVVPGPLGFLYIPVEDGMVEQAVASDDTGEVTTTHVRTPLGALRTERRRSPDIYTTWTTEHLVKDDRDVDRLLSIPYHKSRAVMPDFAEMRARVADRGIMLLDLPDPVCLIAGLMEFEDYCLLGSTDEARFRTVLDFFAARLHDYLDSVLEQGGGPLFRIIGPEYCTPPYMRPEQFRKYVVEYDLPLIQRIHRAGCFARLHCHGRIALVADMILEMSPDALDPVEAPPSGDIEFGAAQAKFGERVCLMGNVQESVFELSSPEEVAETVLRHLKVGKEGPPFVLMPTSTPITVPLPSRVEENLFAFVETALRYG